MSINSASDAKMFNQLCSSGKADSSQVKTTTAPVSSASPITGGLTTQTTIKTTYTSAYTQEELAALQKKIKNFSPVLVVVYYHFLKITLEQDVRLLKR